VEVEDIALPFVDIFIFDNPILSKDTQKYDWGSKEAWLNNFSFHSWDSCFSISFNLDSSFAERPKPISFPRFFSSVLWV